MKVGIVFIFPTVLNLHWVIFHSTIRVQHTKEKGEVILTQDISLKVENVKSYVLYQASMVLETLMCGKPMTHFHFLQQGLTRIRS